MSDTVITIEGLSKSYVLGHRSAEGVRYVAFRDVIARETRNFARKAVDFARGRQIVQGDEVEEFWALRDVNLEVKRGEVLGIIGRNGAGKSTLLKILSRITEPTEGRVVLRGRVASLLEVGTGFHPELTGRENIFLNGAILGMTQREILAKFDEIVAFAEVERFLDTPVKRYSSGMYVRLAFAIAAHLEPEILIVDEVLAVGDVEFQRKCLGKLNEVARQSRTVLFVSHNMGAVKSLTQRCILIEQGRIAASGSSEDVIRAYVDKALVARSAALGARDLAMFRRSDKGRAEARIVGIGLSGASAAPDILPRVAMGDKFTIEVELEVYEALRAADLWFVLKTSQGDCVTSMTASDQDLVVSLEPGRHAVKVTIADLPLAPGRYLLDFGVDPVVDGTACDKIQDYPILSVENEGQITHWLNRPRGIAFCKEVEWVITEAPAGRPEGILGSSQ